MTPLANIIRLQNLTFEESFLITGAINRTIWEKTNKFALEMEGQLTKYLETGGPFATNGVIVGRLLDTPWQPAVDVNIAIGAGLSYAFGIPPIESEHLARTSKTLFYLLFEVDFNPLGDERFRTVFRIHHRSGIFGLFDDVTGGSDYLCLGLKYLL
jgi:hypothetical protein